MTDDPLNDISCDEDFEVLPSAATIAWLAELRLGCHVTEWLSIAPARCLYGARAIRELRGCGCRYPIGDPESADFHFCNEVRNAGSYCKIHAALCFRPFPG